MEELRRIREEAGLSQAQLARESGVDRATINKIEQGKRSPSITTLESLSRALDVEMADFFPKAQAPLWPEAKLESERRGPGDWQQVLSETLGIDVREISVNKDVFAEWDTLTTNLEELVKENEHLRAENERLGAFVGNLREQLHKVGERA